MSDESSRKTPAESRRVRLARERCEHAIGILGRVIADERGSELLRDACRDEVVRLESALSDTARLWRIFGAGEVGAR